MRLRTLESFWLIKNGLLHTYPCLSQNLKTDIVVVGAGISGALISHALRKHGYKVIVVDKNDVAFGSTAATTSMLQYEIDTPLCDLEEMIGNEGASQCYLAGVQAIDDLHKLVKTEKIDCGFALKDSLYFAHSADAAKDLKCEFEARKKIGLPVKWVSRTEVKKTYGIKSFGAILSKKGASVDAYKLAHGLFYKNANQAKNPIQVFDQSPITKIVENQRGVDVFFENASKVSCKFIVYCSGFEATTILKEKVADLFDTYACVSEPLIKLPSSVQKTLLWDTSEPYIYMRTTDDLRFLIGGEDSSFRMGLVREKMKAHKSKRLIERLQNIAPQIKFNEDFTWAGTFGKTKDGLPYIGKSPEYKRSFFVLGFGGNGITFSTQAMKLLPEMMTGEMPSLGYYYRFGR